MRKAGFRIAVVAALCTAATAAGLMPASPALGTGDVPAQYIAKLYTEALGRQPDQSGWAAAVSFFEASGCSTATLTTKGTQFFQSAEFSGLDYSNAEKVLVGYRTVLSTEPLQSDFDNAVAALNSGLTFTTFIGNLYSSAAFGSMASTICTASQGYGWGANPAPTLPVATSGFSGSQAALQATIDAAAPGSTVALAQGAVVRLTSALEVKPGVTLTTFGSPARQSYAKLGRLVREPGFTEAAVVLDPGARLQRLWVSGDRGREASYDRNRWTVEGHGGADTGVLDSRVDNPAGASSIRLLGAGNGLPCSANRVQGNLVESYVADYFSVRQTDAISVGCENTTISGNAVIDHTDVGIIIFSVSPTVPQASQVTGNTVIATGHNANAAYAADAYICDPPDGAGVASRSFAGTRMSDNLFWTSSKAYFQFGLSVGTRAWFSTNGCNGTGGTFTGNNTGTGSARVGSGIVVSGILNTTVTGNNPTVTLVPGVNTCPVQTVGASYTAGLASGTVQTFTDAAYIGCVYWP